MVLFEVVADGGYSFGGVDGRVKRLDVAGAEVSCRCDFVVVLQCCETL